MPLYLHENIPYCGELGIWEIIETEDFFQNQLNFTTREQEQLAKIKGEQRRLEWLSSRHLLHTMSGRDLRGECIKDEHGKPYLDLSPFHISLSHSHGLAAVIAAPAKVGIDIQRMVAKIERIAHKFVGEKEMKSLIDSTRLEQLHIYWGAKEAIYKAYGRRQLDFKKHIFIESIEFEPHGDAMMGKVVKDGCRTDYQIWYRMVEEYVLVYAMQIE